MFIAAATAALLSAAPADPDLSWMAGYWLDCSDGREASETWSDPRAGLMVGHAVSVSASGGVSFEVAQISKLPQGVTYLAQPNGMPPTAFVLTESGPMRAVFVNEQNDFPTRIIYSREGDALSARIEGTMNGQPASMSWSFRAAPLNTRCAASS
ncbi:MAG TPA: DUF6265 family protein [Brevundimonas sp.]|jgi:hypothetical protein|uniref:DUF6265 family protein n=1 Tax=Brevundimonas sp. TaxID=1871086 RepID=UPI002DE32F36|nr:DUF6265 family protein [Brevundimonas sp.]